MSKYWSPIVKKLDPYVPGEQPRVGNLIKLNTNENPYGPSPRSLREMARQVNDSLRLYPDPNSDMVKDAVAEYFAIKPEQVFVGNGSDEVLAHAFLALFRQDKPLLVPDISYSFYPVYCNLYEIESVQIPLRENFEIDLLDYRQDNGGILFANPNAPTGRYLALEKIEELLKFNTDSVVAVDEAYIDFGGESAVSLLGKYDNLLVIQTLSKSRCLAGLRVGFAMGHEELIEGLDRVKNSFNSYPLDRLATVGAASAIRDREYLETTTKRVIASRTRLVEQLGELGFEILPSRANFVFARYPGRDAAQLSMMLRQRKILVRHFRQPRIEQFLRISVGTEEECEELIRTLSEILEE